MAIKKDYTIGIDVGGTKMGGILFDGENVVADFTLATPLDNLEHFLIMLQAVIEPLLEKAKELKVKIKGVGLGVAGAINYQERKMLKSPNIPIIDGVKLADLLEQKIGLPVIMDNDCHCFARAESLLGATKNYQNVFGVIIGTGIGGTWWRNGEVYKGANGVCEPGAMVIDFDKELQLENAYHKLLQNNPEQMAEEAYRGDVLAQKAFEEVGKYLGLAFGNIINIIDPEVIVIGGGVVQASDLFLPSLKSYMVKYIESSEARKKIKIVKSKLGAQAGAIGAALLI